MALSIIYTTFSSLDEAKAVAEQAVSAGRAACVNIFPEISSIYKWNDKVESAQEYAALFKTTADLSDNLEEWIQAKHSYETPAILIFSADTTVKFLEYVQKQVMLENL